MKKLVIGDELVKSHKAICDWCGETKKCFQSTNSVIFRPAKYLGCTWMLDEHDMPANYYGLFGYNGGRLKRALSVESIYGAGDLEVINQDICSDCAKQLAKA